VKEPRERDVILNAFHLVCQFRSVLLLERAHGNIAELSKRFISCNAFMPSSPSQRRSQANASSSREKTLSMTPLLAATSSGNLEDSILDCGIR